MADTKTQIGQYRPAHRVREGWQVRLLDIVTRAESWVTVTDILRVYAPINLVRFTFDNGPEAAAGVLHDTDVFCRSLAEIKRAEAGGDRG